MFPVVKPSSQAQATSHELQAPVALTNASESEAWIEVKHPQGWIYFFDATGRRVVDRREDKPHASWNTDNELEAFYSVLPDGEASREEIFHHNHNVYDYPPKNNIPTNSDESRMRYWKYIADHPSHTNTPLYAHDEAMRLLRWCSVEACFPVPKPIAPFPPERSQQLMTLLSSFGNPENPHYDDDDSSDNNAVHIMLIALILTKKYESRMNCNFGQDQRDDFQMQSSQELPQPKLRNRISQIILRITCFGIPFRYLRYLSEVDKVFLPEEDWRLHIQRIVGEWRDFNLLATVLLSASVGFLAVPGISPVPRTATLISMLFAFGSIITGLYCISVYQSRALIVDDTGGPSNVHSYQNNILRHRQGNAIVLSLPLVFLLWSVISLTTGILTYNLLGTEENGVISGTAYAVVSIGVIVLFAMSAAPQSLRNVWGSRSRKLGVPRPSVRDHFPFTFIYRRESRVDREEPTP